MTRFSYLETYADLNVVCACKIMVMCSMRYIFLHSGWTSYSADRHTTAEQPHRTDVTTDICHATHVRGQEGYPEEPVFKMSSKSTLLWWGWYYENDDYHHHAWMFPLKSIGLWQGPCNLYFIHPFLSVMYFFLPPFSTNCSSIHSHLIVPSNSWSTSQSCCSQIHI